MDSLTPDGRRNFDAVVASAVISTVAAGLRFVCKSSTKTGFRMDDVWMTFTMACYCVSGGVTIWGLLAGGGGMPILTLILNDRFDEVRDYAFSLFLGLIFYLCVAYGLKMTLLTFYNHIFTTKSYRRFTFAVMGASTAWFIGSVLGVVFDCKPVDHFWNQHKPGKCHDFNTYMIGTNVVEMLIDITVFALPTRMVLGLQMPKRTKFLLASVFMLGVFTIVTSIIRLRFIYQKSDILLDFSWGQFWSSIHLMTGVICASAPLYKPLWSPLSRTIADVKKFYQVTLRSPLSRSDKSKTSESLTYLPLQESSKSRSATTIGRSSSNGSQEEGHRATIISDHGDHQSMYSTMPPHSGILRSDQVTVSSVPSQKRSESFRFSWPLAH